MRDLHASNPAHSLMPRMCLNDQVMTAPQTSTAAAEHLDPLVSSYSSLKTTVNDGHPYPSACSSVSIENGVYASLSPSPAETLSPSRKAPALMLMRSPKSKETKHSTCLDQSNLWSTGSSSTYL